MAKPAQNAKKILERLRSNESVGALAGELGLRDTEVQLARDLVRKLGEHQAPAAGRLPDILAQAVVEAAVQIEHADFLKALAESGSKAASSAARRGLSILRSRGIHVEVEQKGEPVFKADAFKPEELPCFVSLPDSRGERLLFFPRTQRGGLQITTVIFSDAAGVVRADGHEVSRKSYRELQEECRAGARGLTFLEVSSARARGYVAAAREKSRAHSLETETALSGLSGDPKDAVSPVRTEQPLGEPTEHERVMESARLHEDSEVRGWMPDEDALRHLELKLDEVSTSSLYVDDKQRHEQLQRELDHAIDAYFTPEQVARYADRLFDLAEALRNLGRREASERAAATARALTRGVAPNSIPFCRRLFDKLIEKNVGAPSAAPAETTSASGLIVPGAPAGE